MSRQSVAENHQLGAKIPLCDEIILTVQSACLFIWTTALELQMLTIIIGFFIVLSIDILVAHAIDAFAPFLRPLERQS